jgi:hypothetical protein
MVALSKGVRRGHAQAVSQKFDTLGHIFTRFRKTTKSVH